MTGPHLRLARPRGLFRLAITVPADCRGFLIRDHLACDLLKPGRHPVRRSDRAVILPAGPFMVPVVLADGRVVAVTLAHLPATYHGTDLYKQFFAEPGSPALADLSALLGSLVRERAHRITDCQAELARLLLGVGLDLRGLEVGPRPAAEPQPATTPADAVDDDEQRLRVRLHLPPELSRRWWCRESLPRFEARLLDLAARHLQTVQRSLAELRQRPDQDRAGLQDLWDLADALHQRLLAQQPEHLVTGPADRARLVQESSRLLSIVEQLAANPCAEAAQAQAVLAPGLEELRRALDRRSTILTTP